jgi:hypothetical protein
MHLGDSASWATIIGTAVALAGLLFTTRQAISNRQRELRGRLREVLRPVSEACDEYRWRRIAARDALYDATVKLKVIVDEGILSPSPRRIRNLQQWILDLGNAAAFLDEEELKAPLDDKTEKLLSDVASLSNKYRHATIKMDNGHIETYLHYRIIGPFVRR